MKINSYRTPLLVRSRISQMSDINEFFRTLGTLPYEALVAAIVITAFGLAGYAIYAVSSIAKDRK